MSNNKKKSVKKPNPTVNAPQSTIQRPAPLGTKVTYSLGGKETPTVKPDVNNKGGKK